MKSPSTIVITGANTGIGAACALLLAKRETHVVLACRSEARAAPVLARVQERLCSSRRRPREIAEIEARPASPANPLALREDLAAQLWAYSEDAVTRACGASDEAAA